MIAPTPFRLPSAAALLGVDLTAVHCERRKALRGASGQADGTGRDAQDADVCLRGIGHGIVVNFAAVQDDAAAAFRGRKADRRRLAGVVMDARAVVHGEVGVMQIENIAAGRNGIADLGARIQRQLAGRAVADDIAGERRAVLGSQRCAPPSMQIFWSVRLPVAFTQNM